MEIKKHLQYIPGFNESGVRSIPPFGSSTLLIAAEKLALPRSATWRLSLGSITSFRCLIRTSGKKAIANLGAQYPTLAALYTVATSSWVIIKSYAILTRFIFHRSSTSTMRSSFELKDERAPCKKTRLNFLIICFTIKLLNQYVGLDQTRTDNDYNSVVH